MLRETQGTLLKDRVSSVGVRSTGHLEVSIRSQDEVELGHAAGRGVLTDRSVPERRAEASEVDALSRGGGSGREVSESAVDGQQSAAFQVIGESLRVVAGRLSHRTREGHGVLAAEDRRGVVGQQNGLGGAERATVGEDAAVAEGDAAVGGADAVGGEAEHAATSGQGAGEGIGRGRIEHPDATVILGHTEGSRASADFIGQHGGDHVHVGVRAAELEGLGLSGDVRAGSISRAVQHVGQDEGARTTGVDTTGTGRASQDDLTGDGLTRAHVSERRSLAVERVAYLEHASGEVGTQVGRRGAGGADGGDHEVTVAEDGLAGVSVQTGQEKRAPALLTERTITADDAGDGREIETGIAVVCDDQVTPATGSHRTIGDGDRSNVRAGGRVLAEVELGVGRDRGNIGAGRNVGAGDHLADREVGGRAGSEADVGVAAESQRQSRGGGRDGDLEVAPDLEVGDRGARVQAERTAAEEVSRAGGITPDRIGQTGPIDDETIVGGREAGETDGRLRAPLPSPGAERPVESTAGFINATPVLEEEVGIRRETGAVAAGDEGAAGDDGIAGVAVSRVAEGPVGGIARAGNGKLGAGRVDELQVDPVIGGRIAGQGQRDRAGCGDRPSILDSARIREDEGRVVLGAASEDIVTVSTVGFDGAAGSGQGEETIDRDGRGLGRLEDILDAVIVRIVA